MENNCLVTKYKADTNDNSLLRIGEMFIEVSPRSVPSVKTQLLAIYNSRDSTTFEVENGENNLTTDSNMESGWTNTITIDKGVLGRIYARNGNYRIKMRSKYNIDTFGTTDNYGERASIVDLEDFKYSTYIRRIQHTCKGDVKHISRLIKLDAFDVMGSRYVYGNLSYFSNLVNLEQLLLGYSPIEGDISVLSTLTKLAELSISSDKIKGDIASLSSPLTKMHFYGSKVTGDLVDFVKTQRANGRTTGSCIVKQPGWGTLITFNGSSTSLQDHTLSWTENTITHDSVTIDE